MTKHPKISKADHETAVRVLMTSKSVVKRALGEALAFGVDLNTPTGKAFIEKECRLQAEKLVVQAK